MRIEALGKRKIVVELNAEDLTALDITYDALDYASIETRRVIWVILDRVRESTGCDIDPSGQLLIDAIPRPTGGCILFFTMRGGCGEPFRSGGQAERLLRKQEQLTLVFEFANLNALLDCANCYARSFGRNNDHALIHTSTLYQQKQKYRLLVCPAKEIAAVEQFFSEFGRYLGDDDATRSMTREHWAHMGEEDSFFALGGDTSSDCHASPKNPIHFCPKGVYDFFF
ncbi:MAG: adaptor protein MecA [Oscillospiraceae bacterium]|jgi:hypothetical protein|nr:adaptor protein MecA [Oscillospiraceae bacterium]